MAALVVVAAPAAVTAQQPVDPAQQAEMQSVVAELQQIQQRLAPIQAEAMETPALQEAQQVLEQMVQEAMAEDPTVAERIDRIQALQREAGEAQAAGDEETLQRLAGEAQQIQTALMAAQEEALERPAIAARLEAFQDALEARMLEIDPDAGDLLERFVELQERLAAAMMGDPGA